MSDLLKFFCSQALKKLFRSSLPFDLSPLLLFYFDALAFRNSWAPLKTLYRRSFIEHNDRQTTFALLGLEPKIKYKSQKTVFFSFMEFDIADHPPPHIICRIFQFFKMNASLIFTISDVKDFMSNKLPSIKQLVQAVAWAH